MTKDSVTFLGIDLGSVTTKIAVAGYDGNVMYSEYIRNKGGPIWAIQEGFKKLHEKGMDDTVAMVGSTGSGRELARVIVGCDTVKNEISSHARSAVFAYPDVGTVIDIGGQDSKVIFFREGYPVSFNMNTVCAAGTGSFLDHQATRLGIPIEEFGAWALRSATPARIAGRCGVFAESDLIHKQQMGYRKEDLIAGLCNSLATNYVTNVARGQPIRPRVLFQGGVAANVGMLKALEEKLGTGITVPSHYKVMGAWGSALLAREKYLSSGETTCFKGISKISSFTARSRGIVCDGCANSCEIQEILIDENPVARWGSKCGKWEDLGRPLPFDKAVS